MALTRERLGSLLTGKNLSESKVLPPTYRLKKHLAASGWRGGGGGGGSLVRPACLSTAPGATPTRPAAWAQGQQELCFQGFAFLSLREDSRPGWVWKALGRLFTHITVRNPAQLSTQAAVYTGAGCSLRRTGAKREKDVERAATCQENGGEGSSAGGNEAAA